MIGRFLTRRSSMLEATVVLAVASLVSRLFGLLRDRSLAAHFGAGDILDAYYAAFRVPDLVFNLLILGALSSAFIPIFTEYLKKRPRGEAWALVNSLINLGVIILAAILGFLAFSAPLWIKAVAPGFDGAKQALTSDMMRVMLFSPLIFGLSNLAGGILNSFRNFVAYAFAPVLYNLGIILGVIVLVPQMGAIGLAYGVVLGAILHLFIQVPGVIKLGWRYQLHLDFRHPAIRRMLILMVPRTMGLAVSQLGLLINTVIASTLAMGSIAVFNLADNLYSLPISLFGISFAVAAFPTLSEKYILGKLSAFRNSIIEIASKIVYFIVPTMVWYWLLRAQIVRLVLGAGKFSWEDTRFTISVLAFFTFGMLAAALIPFLARSFYAMQDTKTPFWASFLGVIINVVTALLLIPHLKVVGLALAVSVAATVNLAVLIFALSLRLKGINWGLVINKGTKIALAALASGLVGYGALRIGAFFVDTHTVLGLFLQTAFTLLICFLVYFVLTLGFKLPETQLVTKAFSKTLKFLHVI